MSNSESLKFMTAAEIRSSFIEFFKSKEHQFVRSSPVVPQDDPTLMFINAGMNQFKSCFLGDNPKKYKRVVNSQKCIRVSGKHNDLDVVGHDTYHHTFFEMLGNWSFGDYYKEEALAWSWELLTEAWKIPKERLFVSVYEGDDEAWDIWKKISGLPDERIMRFDAESNFWEMGDTGPCGPCSEIHYDNGDLATQEETFRDPILGVNGENERYIEIWNNVFMQYERVGSGDLIPLAAKHVDTGMGFERVCTILQGVHSNYDTDVFSPLIDEIARLSGVPYSRDEKGTPHRVIADHLRTLTFAITDGALPANEGRGYVLRRILRRASRYARLLNQTKPFIYQILPVLVQNMGEAFPEIRERQDFVRDVIRSEEERFIRTLDAGLDRFSKIVADLDGSTEIAGEQVFLLYDTYGFPPDLTRILAEEQDLSIDEAGFDKEMEMQKERARASQKQGLSAGGSEGWTIFAEGSTEFLGYEHAQAQVKVLRYRMDAGKLSLVLDRTPFYAESGGQVGEFGVLQSEALDLSIIDTLKVNDIWIHRADVITGELNDENMAKDFVAIPDKKQREATRKNHSATHLLQSALQKVVGDHVQQQGSRVDSQSLRFDFTAFQAVTAEQLREVEVLVNQQIQACLSVQCENMSMEDAQNRGALAFFGEKYGDEVRVVSMGEFSQELCGGLHVENTGEIGMFRILSESSVSSGVRRIEATTALAALSTSQEEFALVEALRGQFRCKTSEVFMRVGQTVEKSKTLEREVKALQTQLASLKAKQILGDAQVVAGVNLWLVELNENPKDFALLAEGVQANSPNGVVVLANLNAQNGAAAVVVDAETIKLGVKAGDIAKFIAEQSGGRGGGRPDRAQVGIKEVKNILPAVQKLVEFIPTLV